MFLKTITLLCLVSLSFAHTRFRRQSPFYGSFTPGNPGTTATFGAKGTIFRDNGHSINGNGQISKTFQPNGPVGYGGGVGYQGPKAGISTNVNHLQRLGTDVGVNANANVWKSHNGRTTVQATGGYNQHLGGPSGNMKPNFNAGVIVGF